MIVLHATTFLVALLLLAFPRPWMRLGAVVGKRRRSAADKARSAEPWNARTPGDPRVMIVREFVRFRNYIDLLRAAVGSVLLMGELGIEPCILATPDAAPGVVWTVKAIAALVMLVGVLAQTVRWENAHLTFYPPVFYLSGLSIGLCGPWAALFAFVLVWAFSPAMGNAQLFLTVYAVVVYAFGHALGGIRDRSTDFAAFLCFLPVLLSFLAHKPLIVLTRKGTHGAAG